MIAGLRVGNGNVVTGDERLRLSFEQLIVDSLRRNRRVEGESRSPIRKRAVWPQISHRARDKLDRRLLRGRVKVARDDDRN